MENKGQMEKAYWVIFSKKGSSEIGYLGVASRVANLPFDLKRCFWTTDTPNTIERGRHAHINTEMVIVALNGEIIVDLEYLDRSKESYTLNDPFKGIYLPKLSWHTLSYSDTAVQLVLTNSFYTEEDYIRDYKAFQKMQKDYLANHKKSTE